MAKDAIPFAKTVTSWREVARFQTAAVLDEALSQLWTLVEEAGLHDPFGSVLADGREGGIMDLQEGCEEEEPLLKTRDGV